MQIHQIQIRHDETEDRLLLRLSTSDNHEFRFWLTRRFVKRLWAMLVQMLSLHPRQGPGIDMTLDTRLLHIFSRLLRQAVAKTDWEMNLGLHGGKEAAEPKQKAVPRKLN